LESRQTSRCTPSPSSVIVERTCGLALSDPLTGVPVTASTNEVAVPVVPELGTQRTPQRTKAVFHLLLVMVVYEST
jgi:hypothetical protein